MVKFAPRKACCRLPRMVKLIGYGKLIRLARRRYRARARPVLAATHGDGRGMHCPASEKFK